MRETPSPKALAAQVKDEKDHLSWINKISGNFEVRKLCLRLFRFIPRSQGWSMAPALQNLCCYWSGGGSKMRPFELPPKERH